MLMVAGGSVDQLTKDSVTATTELLLPGAKTWIQGRPLPRARGGVRAASDPNGLVVFLTGIDRSVLWLREADAEWEGVGTTKEGFWMHTTVAGDLASLCH